MELVINIARPAFVLHVYFYSTNINDVPRAPGYAIYEMLGSTERCVGAEEVLADVMSRWERYRQATQQNASHHHIFLFKVTWRSSGSL